MHYRFAVSVEEPAIGYTTFVEETQEPSFVTTVHAAEDEGIPLSLFKTPMSPSRLVIKYLVEVLHYRFSRIAQLLGKSYANVWSSYAKVKDRPLTYASESSRIPLSLFSPSPLTLFEAIVWYLKKNHSYACIARLLHRDPRTIWTVANRAKTKLRGGGS